MLNVVLRLAHLFDREIELWFDISLDLDRWLNDDAFATLRGSLPDVQSGAW